MDKPTLNENIKLILKSSKAYRGILFIGIIFMTIGVILAFCGLHFDIIFLMIFGELWVAFSLFFILYTIPSSTTNDSKTYIIR